MAAASATTAGKRESGAEFYFHASLNHMCAMMLSPNAEHLISVAPSIRRAKS